MKEFNNLIDNQEKIHQRKLSIARFEKKISDNQDGIQEILTKDMARLIQRIESQEELENSVTITGWELAPSFQQHKDCMKIIFLWKFNEELSTGKFSKIYKSLKQIVQPYKGYPKEARLIIKEMMDKYNIIFSFQLHD